MPAAKPGAALTANGINFVNKHNARSALFGLFKQIAHTGSAYADKHFHKVRAGNAEERYARFTGNGFGKQGFACTRRPV